MDNQIDEILFDLETLKKKIVTLKQSIGREEFGTKKISNNDFEDLKSLLQSDNWPYAVPDSAICDHTSEHDKNDRADGIIDAMVEDLKGKSFLDFGCGEGHLAKVATDKGAKKSIGYDIVKTGKLEWESTNDSYLTTNFEKVKQDSPFDVILLYDVLDHAENPKEVMSQVKSICHKDTLVIVRCHPWCSRHGGHYYQELNKAFVHLIFSEEELKSLGMTLSIHTNHVIHPISFYSELMKDFKEVSEKQILRTPVEKFFKNNEIIKERIKLNWIGISNQSDLKSGNKFPDFQMSQDFLDYELKLK